MKAFVTGGTGFLGTHLVKQLDHDGWEIHALHRSEKGLAELRKCRQMTLCKGDILDIESLRRGMPDGVDAVFHLAGSVENLAHHEEQSRYEINQTGTRNVVDVALEKKAGRFIHTSTVLTYDFHAGPRLTESSPRNHGTGDPYMQSKVLAEVEADKGLAAGLDVVYMHPSAVFGSYDTSTWSKYFTELKRGLPLPFAPPGELSACHAGAVAKAFVKAFERAPKGAHYLLGGPDATILEIGQEIARIIGCKPPTTVIPAPIFKLYGWSEFLISTYIVRREPMLTPRVFNILVESVLCDSTRAEKELDYVSPSLHEMLVDCHEWMKQVGMI